MLISSIVTFRVYYGFIMIYMICAIIHPYKLIVSSIDLSYPDLVREAAKKDGGG